MSCLMVTAMQSAWRERGGKVGMPERSGDHSRRGAPTSGMFACDLDRDPHTDDAYVGIPRGARSWDTFSTRAVNTATDFRCEVTLTRF